ncbi:MAG: alpha amylase C-terminal domain-containing protein [Lachnospiraceae bacterium]|nr:alpha amylase C-terminal domain-containing protein [Lachnospiraceae bacterium]
MKDKLYQLMNWPKIEGIVYSEEDHPGEILGPQIAGNSILYQAFFPYAQKAVLCLEEKGRRITMEQADESGFFAATASGKTKEPYHYELLKMDGSTRKVKDPYAFPVVIEEDEIRQFHHGIHYELYRLLGSHVDTMSGVRGVRFVVWMPGAVRVSVVGEFNYWDGRVCPMNRVGDSDFFALFIPDLDENTPYQYEVKMPGDKILLKEDYFATPIDIDQRSCSHCYQEEEFIWEDKAFLEKRSSFNQNPFFYEAAEEELKNPQKMAEKLSAGGFTHLVLPAAFGGKHFYRFSFDFAAKNRIKELVNTIHQAGMGVLIQWDVGGIHGLGQKEFSNFYIANVLYIVEQYHMDGIVFSQMAPLLYLDYGKEPGQWKPNMYGGNENLEAVEWIKHTNSILRKRNKGILLIANLDAIWPRVTDALKEDGLGFDYRYDTDFASEFIQYLECDPYFRSGIHEKITDRMLYAYHEKFVMAFNQDMTKALWDKLSGEAAEKFSTIKLALAYAMFLPGKVLSSFAVPRALEEKLTKMVKESYHWNHTLSPLEKEDLRSENFRWINCFQHNDCTVSFFRQSEDGEEIIVVVANFANAAKEDFTIGVPEEGKYKLFFHTEGTAFGGKVSIKDSLLFTEEKEWDGWNQSITINIEPLSLQAFVFVPYTEEELYEIARIKAEAIRLKLEEEARNKANKLKKSSLKDRLAIQVEMAEEAISKGSESKKKLESKRKNPSPQKRG